jgi:hypothetical protein
LACSAEGDDWRCIKVEAAVRVLKNKSLPNDLLKTIICLRVADYSEGAEDDFVPRIP